MSSLFSTFDPQSFFSFPIAWVSVFTLFLFWPAKFWVFPNSISQSFLFVASSVKQEFKMIMGSWCDSSILLKSIGMLLFLMLNNFLGLFPYVFTASSHLSFTLALALPLWIGHMFMAWMKIPQSMLAHLVPLGTPPALMPFMVLIELISNVIRPLTLSVRLAANMMAGHLLLTLLTQGAPHASIVLVLCMLSAVIALAALESAVALIQAYVFSVLSTLYLQEVNSTSLSS